MGYTISWAAIKSGDLETACSVFGLHAIGVMEDIHTSRIGGIRLPQGWYVTYFKKKDIEDLFLEKLSHSGEVVHCFIEDHLMISASSGWKSGRRIWKVAYNAGGISRLTLETSGDLPPAFDGIRTTQLAKQKTAEEQGHLEEDYVYDVPIELAKELTGFYIDQDTSSMSVDVFEVSQPVKQTRSGEGTFLNQISARRLRDEAE